MTAALQFFAFLVGYAAIVGAIAYGGATAQRFVMRSYHVDLTWWFFLLSAFFFWVRFWEPFAQPTGGCYSAAVLRLRDISDYYSVLGWGAFMFLGLGARLAKSDGPSTLTTFLLLAAMVVFGLVFFVQALSGTVSPCR